MKIKQSLVKQITLCTGLLLLAQTTSLKAAAGKDTWTGGAGTANWADAGNWTGANMPPAASDTPTFGTVGTGGATLNNNLGALTSFAGMTINSGAPSFVLNGNAIDSTGGIVDNSLNLQTVNLALQFTITHSISAAGGGTMLVGGVISGPGGVTKTGAGTVTLTNANLYTGTTTISAGILNLDFNAAGAPSANIVKSTSPLALSGGKLNLNGNTAAGSAQTFASTAVTGANAITVTAPSGQTETLTLGAISQSAVGAALAILPSGSGTTTVAGTAGTSVSAPASAPINSTTAGFVSGAFVTYGLNDYATISTGTLLPLGSTPANYTANAGPNADVQSGGYTTPTTTTSIAAMRFNTAGSSTVTVRTVYTTGGTMVTPNVGANNQFITSSGTTHAYEPNRSSTSGSESVIWQNNITGYLVFSGATFLDNGKTGAATWVQAGPGTVQYNQTAATSATFTGSMYLDGGYTLVTANGNAVFGTQTTAATLNLNGGTVVADSVFALDNAGANLRPVAILNAGGGLAATAGNSMLIDGTISGAAGTGTLTIGIPASSANTNVVGLVPGSGAGTANSTPVFATGTVIMSGTNTYTGNTIISSGTLMLTNNGTISNTASITVASGAGFDVSALPAGYTLGGVQALAGSGTNNGSITAASGTIIYAGTDGVYGTNTFNNNLTNLSGALIYMDVGTVYNGANDFISIGGTLAMNGTTFHLKAPSAAVSLDTTHDYVLMTAAGLTGAPNSTPVWEVQPANAANFIMAVSGNSVVLRYSAAAPPSGSGIATPGTVNRNQSTLITVTATAGSSPVSTVVLDASLLGGSSTLTLTRSNTSSLYTNTVAVSAGQAPGVYSLPATITDTSSPTPLSSVVNISLTVVNSQVWDGAGANDNWSGGANWVSGISPVTGDFVTFAGSTRPTPSMDSSYNLTGIAFNSTAGSFTLGTPSSILTLTANGITNSSANTETVNTPLVLTAPQTFSAASGNLVLTQPIDNGGNLVSFDGSRTNTVSGILSGSGGLTKNGSGTNVLTAINTYAGTTTINAGVIQLNSGGAINCLAVNLPANTSSQLQVLNGSVTATNLVNVGQTCSLLLSSGTANFPGGIQTDVTTSANVADLISVTGGSLTAFSVTLGRTGTSATTQPASGSTANGLYVNGGAVNITSNLNVTTIVNGNANSTVNARVDSGSLNVSGALIIGLNNAGRWSDFDVTGGTVSVNDPALGISIGGPFAGNAVFLMRGGTVTTPLIGLGYGAIADTVVLSQSGGNLYLGSGGIVKVSAGATASVTLSGGTLGASADWSTLMPIAISGSPTIKAADASNVPHNIALNGVLSGGGTLTKSGNGVLSMGGANTYGGLTTVSAGSLQLTNDGGSLNGTVAGSISVSSNAIFDVTGLTGVGGFTLGSAKTISGAGIVAGQFAAMDGSTISPAGVGAEGQLSFTNGLTAQNMTFKMDLSSDPTGTTLVNDGVSITGDFTANGVDTVAVTPVGSLGLGTYKLIKYTGTFNGSLGNLTCAAGVLTNPPGEIDLIVTSVRPVANLVWRGDGVSDQWDTGISSTWQNGASLDKFYTGDTNTFDDTAVSFNVNPSGVVVPANSVILVNATHDYTFNNTGGDISGNTGLTKTNTGNLTMLGNNDYVGVTTINGGTLSAQTLASGGVASSIGAATPAATNLVLNGGTLAYLGGSVNIDRSATLGNSGGTLNVPGGTTLTLSGVLTGPGSLTKTGNGQITLNNANNYLGGTVISAGTIRGNPAAVIGTNTLTIDGTVNQSTFEFGADSQTMSDVLNVIGVNGILANNGNETLGHVTGNGTINLDGNSGNTLTLSAADSTAFTGTFMINTLPILRFLPSSGSSVNASNATFNLGSGSSQVNNRDGGTFSMGALAGGSGTFLRGSANSGSVATTYTIGGNNTDADFSGTITTGVGGTGAKVNIVKVGTGRQTLSGANTYNGATTVNSGVLALGDGSTDGSINNSTPVTLSSNGVLDVGLRSDATFTVGGSATQLLQGSGTIFGQLNVGGSGTVAPGDSTPTIGKLTVTNAVTLGGTVLIKLSHGATPNCDQLVSSSTLTYGGTLTVTSVGSALHAGDTFTIFNAAGGFSGSFAQTNLPVLGGGLGLNWDPTTAKLTVVQTVNTAPTNIVTTINGNTLTLTWPADHTGWRLQAQTNGLATGLNTNWTDVAGAAATNSVSTTVDTSKGTVFYRLVYP